MPGRLGGAMIEGGLRGSIDGDEHMQRALFDPHLGDVVVTAMERRACQVWDRRLQGIEAGVERQQRIAQEREPKLKPWLVSGKQAVKINDKQDAEHARSRPKKL